MYHRLLIYDVKRTTKIDCMGHFNSTSSFWREVHKVSFFLWKSIEKVTYGSSYFSRLYTAIIRGEQRASRLLVILMDLHIRNVIHCRRIE